MAEVVTATGGVCTNFTSESTHVAGNVLHFS